MRTRSPTVYLIYGQKRELLYVGCSVDAMGRLAAHANQRVWWKQVVSVEVEHFDTLSEALERECECIRTLSPRHNVKSRVDLPKLPRVFIRRVNGVYVDPWDAFPGHRTFLMAFRERLFAIHPRLNDEAIAEMLGLNVREYQNLGNRPGGIPEHIFNRRDEIMAEFAALIHRTPATTARAS